MSEILSGFDPLKIIAMIVALLVAIIGHEIMHGKLADIFGDSTAKDAGRLSLNPISHIDPIGTIALPLMLLISGSGILFGWAKPVPVNVRKVLQKGQMAMVAVSLAGIAYNLIVAFVAAQFLATADQGTFIYILLSYLILWNVVLAVFNLLPIPPLDGSNALSHLFAYFGNYKVGAFFERVGNLGFVVLLVIMLTDLKYAVFAMMDFVIRLML